MTTSYAFTEVIDSEERLREIIGAPADPVIAKVIHEIDDLCAAVIESSPFLLIASSDRDGNVDVSPKGDPPGFVHVLDGKTLVIPDRPGNRRADTFTNILQNDHVGLIFLVPGKEETLRVSGRARIVRDEALGERLTVRGKAPALLLVIDVEEVFFHCAKCIIRSQLWEEGWEVPDGLPSLAEAMQRHGSQRSTIEEVQQRIDLSYKERLY